MKIQGLLFSTLFLAAINVLIRIFGFFYRVLLVRLIGSEGLGLFELVSPVTSLIGTIVGSGVPIAMIRLTTKSMANNRPRQSLKTLEYISLVMIIVSLILSISLFIVAPFIATHVLKDERLLTPLYIFAPAILFPALAALLRGYFYGSKNVVPPAFSQLGEQLTRMLVVVTLLSILYPFEEDKAITISMVGNVFGELIGITILALFFIKIRKKILNQENISVEKSSFIKTIGGFTSIALPITLSRVISSLLRVASSIMVPGRLVASGLDQSTSLSYFGQVNGMVMPLLFIPFTLTSALVMNLIPRISEAVERKNNTLLHHYMDKTFHIAFLIGLPLSGIFCLFSDEIFFILYGEGKGIFLSQLSIATLLLCIYQISASILQGIGRQIVSTNNFIFGMLIQLGMTYILVGNPAFRIQGYIISFLTSYCIITLINFCMVFHFTKDKIAVKKWMIKPMIATICALVFSRYLFQLIQGDFMSFLTLAISLMAFFIIYILFLFLQGNIQYFLKK